MVLEFRPGSNPNRRLPAFYLNNQGQIHAYHRCSTAQKWVLIGHWEDLTPDVYHHIIFKQKLGQDGKYRVKFYIDGNKQKAIQLDYVPDEVHSDVKILLAESKDNAVYFIKELDYFF